MDYYEELGLSRMASVDEIRQAYGRSAWLIHPDRQADDRLRALAEIHMKHLNRIGEVLTDPAQRREYDRSLAAAMQLVPVAAPPPPARRSVLSEWVRHVDRSAWVWVAAWLVGIAAIGVFGGYGGSGRIPVEKSYTKPYPAPFLPGGPVERTKAAAQLVQRLPPGLSRPSSPPEPYSPEGLPPGPEIAMEPQDGMLQLPLPRLEAPPGFAGNWLYAPSGGLSKKMKLYAPEFIEMNIAGRDGQISGLYRARYLVTDKAISSAVVFHFDGRAAAPVSTLPWMGSGGAYGRMTLKLVSKNSLQVNWTAEHLSEDLGLISGTATLVRRKDPQ